MVDVSTALCTLVSRVAVGDMCTEIAVKSSERETFTRKFHTRVIYSFPIDSINIAIK